MLLGVTPISFGARPATGIDVIGTMKAQGAKQGLIGGSGSGAASSWTTLAGYSFAFRTIRIQNAAASASTTDDWTAQN
jgi:hypothetical protein